MIGSARRVAKFALRSQGWRMLSISLARIRLCSTMYPHVLYTSTVRLLSPSSMNATKSSPANNLLAQGDLHGHHSRLQHQQLLPPYLLPSLTPRRLRPASKDTHVGVSVPGRNIQTVRTRCKWRKILRQSVSLRSYANRGRPSTSSRRSKTDQNDGNIQTDLHTYPKSSISLRKPKIRRTMKTKLATGISLC